MMGGCEITDARQWLSDNDSNTYERIWGTTIGSLISPRRSISDKVHDWYSKLSPEEQRLNIAQRIHKEVVLKDHFESCDDNSYLIISLLYESMTRYWKHGEHITLIPELDSLGKDSNGDWNKDKLHKLKFPIEVFDQLNDPVNAASIYNNDTAKNFFGGEDWLSQYADMITEKFGDRVILLNIPPARIYHNMHFGVYHQLPEVTRYAYKTAFLNIDDYTWKEHFKVLNLVHRYLIRSLPKRINTIQYDWKKIIGDDHHRAGRGPFHYTDKTCSHIAKEILKVVKELGLNS